MNSLRLSQMILIMDRDTFEAERRFSHICDEFPCKIRYPLYYKAHKKEYIINPGEMIFIPAGWFHLVYSEGEDLNFALNFNVQDDCEFKEGKNGTLVPRVEKSGLEPHKNFSKYFKYDRKLRVLNDPSGAIPSDMLLYRYPTTDYSLKTISQFCDNARPNDYLMQNLADYPLPVPHVITTGYMSAVWVNFCNVRTYIHYDLLNNWLCQLAGRKRIIVFPPEDIDLLYMINPYPIHLILSLVGDEFVKHIKSEMDSAKVEDMCKALGGKTRILLENPKRIVSRNVSDLNNFKMFKMWMLVYTTLTIRDKDYRLRPGDYIEWPNSFTHMYSFALPPVFVSEMEGR